MGEDPGKPKRKQKDAFDLAFDNSFEGIKRVPKTNGKAQSNGEGDAFDKAFANTFKKKELFGTESSPSLSESPLPESTGETIVAEPIQTLTDFATQIDKSTQAYAEKRLKPKDVGVLAQTDWGKSQGLNIAKEDAKIFADTHNGPKVTEVNNDVVGILNANYPQTASIAQNLTRDQIFKGVSAGDTNTTVKARDSIINTKQQEILQIQKQPEGGPEASGIIGAPMYAVGTSTRKGLSEEQKARVTQLQADIEQTRNVFDAYTANAIVNKRENRAQIEVETSGKGKLMSSIAAEGIGKELDEKIGIQKTTPNTQYERTRAGIEQIISTLTQETNDLVNTGLKSQNPELLVQAEKKAAQVDQYIVWRNNLDNHFPDVGTYKTARFLGDILAELKPNRLVTSKKDVLEAAQEAEKRYPGFMQTHGKFVDLVAQSEGEGLGAVTSGMVPQGGVLGGIKAGTAEIPYNAAGFVAAPFGHVLDERVHQKSKELLEQVQHQGTSSVRPTKIIYDGNGKAFREEANKEYGTWDFNSSMYQLGKGIPTLAEWVALDKGIGGAAKFAATGVAKGLQAGAELGAEVASNVSRGTKYTLEGSFAVKPGFERWAGLYGATYVTSYDHNHELAQSLIPDTADHADAKRNVLANFLTLATAGVFRMFDISPSVMVEKAVTKSIGPDAIKYFEQHGWEAFNQQAVEGFLKEQVLPRVAAVAKKGAENVGGGAKLGAATVVDQKIKDFASVIVNPDKAKVSTPEENLHTMVDQVLLMTAVGLPGMIKSGKFSPTAKDALFTAGILAPQTIERIQAKVENGELDRAKGGQMISMVETLYHEVRKIRTAHSLTTAQKKAKVISNFRERGAAMLKENGATDINPEEIKAEETINRQNIDNDKQVIPVEESTAFITAKNEAGGKPQSIDEIDPRQNYTYEKDGKPVTTDGAELLDHLQNGDLVKAPKPEQLVKKPSEEQVNIEEQGGETVTLTYNSETEIPEAFKDKISAAGTINGERRVQVTVSKAEADFELERLKEQQQAKAEEDRIKNEEIDQQIELEKKRTAEKLKQEEQSKSEKELIKAESAAKIDKLEKGKEEISEDEGVPQWEDFAQIGFRFYDYDKESRLGGERLMEVIGFDKHHDTVHVRAKNVRTGKEEIYGNIKDHLDTIQAQHRHINRGVAAAEAEAKKSISSQSKIENNGNQSAEIQGNLENAKPGVNQGDQKGNQEGNQPGPGKGPGEVNVENKGTASSEAVPSTEFKPHNKDTNIEYITKSKKQRVFKENGVVKVVDAKTGEPVLQKKIVKRKGKDVVEWSGRKTHNKAIQEYADNFDFTHGEKLPEDIPEGVVFKDQNEGLGWAIENSQNPTEIASIFANEEIAEHPLNTKERMIADYGGFSTNEDSYARHGDRNNINNAKARSYGLDKESPSLDVIAKEYSDHYGIDISPEDLVSFMDRFPNGVEQAHQEFESDIAKKAATKFQELTGLPLTAEIAEKAINQEFEKLDHINQELLKRDYATEQDIIDNFRKSVEGTGAEPKTETKPAKGKGDIANAEQQVGKKAAEPSESKPAEAKAEGVSLADKIRKLKIDQAKVGEFLTGDKNALQSNIFGVPFEIYNTLIEGVAKAIDAGADLATAIKRAVSEAKLSSNERRDFDEAGFAEHLEDFAAGKKPKIKVQAGDTTGEKPMTGITHAETAINREQLGMEQYQRTPKKQAELEAEAQGVMSEKGFSPEKMLDEINGRIARGKGTATDVENEVMRRYKASLEAKINKNPTTDLISKHKDLIYTLDLAGTAAGRGLASRKGLVPVEDTLADYLSRESEAKGGDNLTEEEIKQGKERFGKQQEVKKKLDEAYERSSKAESTKQAEKEVKKAKDAVAKEKPTERKKKQKTHEDYVKERKTIIEKMREDLLKAAKGGEGLTASVPYAAQLKAIAPHVAKLVKSLVAEGVDNLDNIIDNIHGDVKDLVQGITKKDVRDIIAGNYNEKQPTKNQLQETLFNLRKEAELLNELDRLRKNEPKEGKTREVNKTQRIKELEEKVKEARRLNKELEGFMGEQTPTARQLGESLAERKKQLTTKIIEIKDRIKKNAYGTEEVVHKPIIKLDKEGQKLQDEYIELKRQDALRRAKAEYDKMSTWRKRLDTAQQLLGINRIVKAAIDFSIVGRQANTIVFNPFKIGTTSRAIRDMLKSARDPAFFKRYMYDIEHSEIGQLFEHFGGTLSKPDEIKLDKREEEFRTNIIHKWFAKAPLLEKLWFSERAAAGFLNTARIEQFAIKSKALMREGITPENSPEHYKEIVKWVMNSTGRGNMLKMLENSQEGRAVANNVLFGARLFAAKFNLLNPMYYGKMSDVMLKEATKDMAGYVSGILMTGLSAVAAGASVSFNPDDSDFLMVRHGKNVYDITGGFAGYIRTFMRMSAAAFRGKKYKQFAFDSAQKSLLWNKLAPNPAYVYHFVTGKGGGYDAHGRPQPFDPLEPIEIWPLVATDVYQGWKDAGPMALMTVLPATFVGIGYQQYPAHPKSRDMILSSETFSLH